MGIKVVVSERTPKVGTVKRSSKPIPKILKGYVMLKTYIYHTVTLLLKPSIVRQVRFFCSGAFLNLIVLVRGFPCKSYFYLEIVAL